MEMLNLRDVSAPSPTDTYDWVAIKQLQNQLHKTQNNFRVEALESALQKALFVSRRISSGIQLAKDLYRDGRKKAKFINNFVSISDSELDNAQISSDRFEENYHHEVVVSTIRVFFRSLNIQQRKALVIALLGLKNDETQVKQRLGIGVRQLWNVLEKIQNQVKSSASLKNAFALALSHWSLEPSDFIKLIEEN